MFVESNVRKKDHDPADYGLESPFSGTRRFAASWPARQRPQRRLPMAARALQSVTRSFGLVSIPVQVYSDINFVNSGRAFARLTSYGTGHRVRQES